MRGTGFILLVAVAVPVWTPATTAGQLPNCTIDFEITFPDDPCPDDLECGATFVGGDGCQVIGVANCYSSGIYSYQVGQGGSLTITLSKDLNSLTVFFAHQVADGAGTMTFLSATGQQVDDPLPTNGPCDGPMPSTHVLFFSQPVRSIAVTNTGVGNLWIDTFEVNPCQDSGDCDDDNACTTDACDGGACTHTPLDCDDGIDCTDDTCVVGTCQHEPLTDDNDEDGEPNCSDGCPDDPNKTSPGECGCGVPEGTCGGGGGGGGGGGSCGTCADDGLFCTGDPVCTNGTCQFTGNPCGGDTPVCCEASGSCVSECCSDTDCDDGDACTDDRCDPFSGCLHDALDCDDGDVCNGSETCHAGNCVSGSPLDCDDGDACTDDSCTDGECVHDPIDCEDGDACTLDGCDPDTGCTHDLIDCEDEDLCTTDTCQDGECLHAPIDCDDGDLCTQDSCANGVCEHNAIICPEGQLCDDGVCASIVQLDPGDPCGDDADCGANEICVEGECLPQECSCGEDSPLMGAIMFCGLFFMRHHMSLRRRQRGIKGVRNAL
ncbi:MAG: hypothetical protein IIA66_09155 [Planctomycetes bacterium]|nr:hypothetical protein [Planctomycetota bacterium]